MNEHISRRAFLELAGVGGVVFASGLAGCSSRAQSPSAQTARGGPAPEDFFFLQLTDTHWGFRGAANPEADVSLKKAVAAISAAASRPDFIVFTGDLTHTTDDATERRARMTQFREIVAPLGGTMRFLPGEHDASLDRGEAYKESFGESRWSFDHKGVHFVGLDNVSDAGGALGDAQLEWLAADVAPLARDAPLVVFAHRPLFDLDVPWEWTTRDGERALAILGRFDHVTVFYGHIHQEHHHRTGTIVHHAARSLVFPLPAPGSARKRAPLPWDPAAADHGLGYRSVTERRGAADLREIPLR